MPRIVVRISKITMVETIVKSKEVKGELAKEIMRKYGAAIHGEAKKLEKGSYIFETEWVTEEKRKDGTTVYHINPKKKIYFDVEVVGSKGEVK